jgi:type I restriction enzyme, S subunit
MNEVLLGELLSRKGVTYGVVKPGDHTPHGIPLIKAADVGNGRVNSAPNFRISQEKHQEHSRTELNGGELLITLVGTPGQCAIAPSEVKGFNVVRAVGVFSTEPIADSRFIMYSIQAPQSQVYLRNVCNTTVQATLNLGDLKCLPLSIPDIKEQKAIAHILGTLDDKIELNRKTDETLEAMAKALFKSWFVDFDPVKAKAEGRSTGLPAEISDLFPDSFEDSELGEIPRGWNVAEIDQIVNLLKDSLDPASTPDETFDHYSIPAFDAGKHPARELGSSIKSQKFLVGDGDLLVSKLNPSTPRVWIPFASSGRRAICSTEFLVCRTSSIFGRAYAYCLASSDAIVEAMTGLAGGTSNSHQRIRPGDFLALPCCIGTEMVRSAFLDVVEPLLGKSLVLRTESRSLSTTRDALLPKLISGEIRIPDAEKMLEEVGV